MTFLVIPGGYDARMSRSPASPSRPRKRLVIPRGTVATMQIRPPGKAPLTKNDLTTGIAWTIADLVAATCLWKDEGWQIGDYRFMVLSVHPAKGVELYVQFWSEPLEPVLWEVSSGRANPPADQVMAGEPSAYVRRLGFRLAGQARNFRREVAMATRRDATRVAAEVVDILYDAFGYRGRPPIHVRLGYEGRSEVKPVYDAFTPQDLCKVLARLGCDAEICRPVRRTPVVIDVRRASDIRAELVLGDRVPHQNLYRSAFLSVGAPGEEDAVVVQQAIGAELLEKAPMRTGVTLHFEGGVTIDWVAGRLVYGLDLAIRLGPAPPVARVRAARGPVVH